MGKICKQQGDRPSTKGQCPLPITPTLGSLQPKVVPLGGSRAATICLAPLLATFQASLAPWLLLCSAGSHLAVASGEDWPRSGRCRGVYPVDLRLASPPAMRSRDLGRRAREGEGSHLAGSLLMTLPWALRRSQASEVVLV